MLAEEGYMKIINLIENTEGHSGCVHSHGLSFYIETKKHKLLLDLGPSAATVSNAETLGIDLSKVDTVILSHGHYDHSGGIIPFAGVNDKAVIYMQESAVGDFYANDEEDEDKPGQYRYIGIDKNIAKLPQVRFLRGDIKIDDEIELFTIKERTHKLPFPNAHLLIRDNADENIYRRDDFIHEQFLVIKLNGKSILLSGCAHNGILSILDAYCEKYGKAPDMVISGFHLMKDAPYDDTELREIEDIANELKSYPTKFVTCHCTSVPAYELMKRIMGDQLEYVHSGEEIL